MISTHISKSNNNSKCEQSLNRNGSQIIFHGQFWLLKNNSFFVFFYMKCSLYLDWFQMPMGYLSFPFNLEKGMRIWRNDEPIKWTIKMME